MRHLLILLVVVLLGAALSARGQAPEATQHKPAAISVAITAVEPTVKLGSPICVKAVVTNVSDHKIILSRAIESQGYAVDMRNAKGALAHESEYGQLLDGRLDWKRLGPQRAEKYLGGHMVNIPLQPDKTWTDVILVSDRYDISQPGKFTIQLHTFDNESKKEVKSNTITITVTQ